MTQKLLGLLLVILFLTACQGSVEEEKEDDFPEFSNEQLEAMIKASPQAQMELNKHTAPKSDNTDFIQKMEEQLLKEPENIEIPYQLAKLYHQKLMVDTSVVNGEKAILYYTKVIASNKEYQEGKPYYNRMLCYSLLNKWDKALDDINQFEQINKGRTAVNYLVMRAEIYYQKGEKDKACQDYLAAVAVMQKDSLPIENESIWEERCD